MKEFLSGVIYCYDADLQSLVTLSGHSFWFMPLLTAIIYYFRCGSDKEPQTEEMLVLVTAQKQSGSSPLLKGAPNQYITCEKENQPPEGQEKVAAMTNHAQGCELLMVWKQRAGQGHLKPKKETFKGRSEAEWEKALCASSLHSRGVMYCLWHGSPQHPSV